MFLDSGLINEFHLVIWSQNKRFGFPQNILMFTNRFHDTLQSSNCLLLSAGILWGKSSTTKPWLSLNGKPTARVATNTHTHMELQKQWEWNNFINEFMNIINWNTTCSYHMLRTTLCISVCVWLWSYSVIKPVEIQKYVSSTMNKKPTKP